MASVAEVFRTFAPEYLARFPHLPHRHRQVIQAIVACRSGELGAILYRCPSCQGRHWIGRACGNRHCPQCQAHKTRQWLERQLQRRVPGPHFLLTFTVPEPLRAFLRSHQLVGYAALFAASSRALKTLARDPRHLGTDLPGFTGVLHTWGRQLQYHPHIHYLVPGGGLSPGRDRWLPSRQDFYLPVHALSALYKAKCKAHFQRTGLLDSVDPAVWQTPWNVHCEPVGDGEHAWRYLASYVFRVAISDRRIVAVAGRTVTIRYTDRESGAPRTTDLEAMEFLRRYLQHVLPCGFMKVRHFGFLNPNAAVPLERIRSLIAALSGHPLRELPAAEERSPWYCPDCGAALVYIRSVLPFQRPRLDTS